MRISVIFFMLFVGTFSIHSQDERSQVSLSLEDNTLLEAIEQIESQTGYVFYFLEEWVKDIRVSGTYENMGIKTVLEQLFENTVINYYISGDYRIYLLQNARIHDSLPEGFWSAREVLIDSLEFEMDESTEPVLYSGYDERETKVVHIGKENADKTGNTFVLSGSALIGSTGQPISDLAILVEGSEVGTSSDSNGHYSLRLPLGENIILTQGLGVQKSRTKIILYGDGSYDFKLSEDYETLDEVVVHGNDNRNVRSAITGVNLIEIEKIKNIPLVLGERDVMKAVVTLPGISTAGEGASGYNVRGGRTDQNLILLDNGTIYNPSHFFGIFSAINPYTTESAKVYKGNIPAEFGGRLSSVFDIQSRDANIEKFSGEASIGPVTSNMVVEIPVLGGKSGLLIGGRATYSDWILKALDDEKLANSRASFYDLFFKYNHSFNEKNDVKATGYYSYDRFSITSDSIYDYSNRLISLQWNHKFNERTAGSLIVHSSGYKFGIGFDGESNNDFDLEYENKETELKLKVKQLYGKKHSLDLGVSSKFYIVNPGSIRPKGQDSQIMSLTIPREQSLESAAFISDNIEIAKRFLLDIGVRFSFYMALGSGSQRIYEEQSPRNASSLLEIREYGKNEVIQTYGGPEFRISSRYFIKPNLSIKASLNNTYQYIHALSNNTTVSPTDIWKLSDINVKPQETYQASLGLYRNIDNDYELSLEAYYKKQKNLLDYKVGAQLLLNETIEAEIIQGDGRAYGFELLLKKNSGKLNGWLGYVYSRSLVRLDGRFNEERINNGEFFPSNFDKPHDISLVANYKFTRRFSISTNFVYQTGRPVTFPIGSFSFSDSEFVFYSDRNKFRIPDYYRLDLSFQMEGNHKIKKFAHSFWSFSIYNVLGRNNPYSVFFVTENGDIKAYQSSIFSIPVPTITYNFKF